MHCTTKGKKAIIGCTAILRVASEFLDVWLYRVRYVSNMPQILKGNFTKLYLWHILGKYWKFYLNIYIYLYIYKKKIHWSLSQNKHCSLGWIMAFTILDLCDTCVLFLLGVAMTDKTTFLWRCACAPLQGSGDYTDC